MLISNTLPQVSAPQATNVAATQSAFMSAAAASASRPLTPAAVNAAAAASPYTPQLPQPRRQATDQASLTPSSGTAGRPAILPDPEFWRVPDRQVKIETPPQAVRTTVETVQKTTAYIAQAVAQELPETQEQPDSTPSLPGARKPAVLAGKKPGVGDSSGFGAYYVASQRSTEMSFPNSVEAFA